MGPYLHPLPDLPVAVTADPAEALALLNDRWVLVSATDCYVLRDPYDRPVPAA